MSDLMLSSDPILGHVNVDHRAGLHEQLPQECLVHLPQTKKNKVSLENCLTVVYLPSCESAHLTLIRLGSSKKNLEI